MNIIEEDNFDIKQPFTLTWDKPHFYWGDSIFTPKIFDANVLGEEIPQSFNSVCIPLDSSLKADLEWKEPRQAACQYVEKGLQLFWDLRLGLFNQLKYPFANQMQFLSLCLSIEHFRDGLWKEFRKNTLGVCLYRGPADFSRHFPWDEQQIANLRQWLKANFTTKASLEDEIHFSIESLDTIDQHNLSKTPQGHNLLKLYCRDASMDYILLLASRLPDGMEGFVLLDAEGLDTPSFEAQMLTKERYENLHVAIQNSQLPIHQESLAWNIGTSPTGFISRTPLQLLSSSAPNIGICLPSTSSPITHPWKELQKGFIAFHESDTHYKVISEEHLITEWDGLDYLIVTSQDLTHQGKRKLQGFCAAGGKVIVIGEPIGLSNEINFQNWSPKDQIKV